MFGVSLSLQLLHGLALLLQSGSHCLHDSCLEKLCTSEKHRKTLGKHFVWYACICQVEKLML